LHGRAVRRLRRLGETAANASQSLSAKIFQFTEIRKCRMCRPSQPTKGAVVRRHERGLGVAVDAGGVKGGLVRAGRDEPREHGTNRIDGRRSNLVKLLAKQETRIRRNRVVLAVVATVKPLRRRQRVNRRGAVHFAGVTETKRNSSPGRARHRPSNHRAGKAWSRLPCVSPMHCVCNQFAWGFLWVPAGARSSLRPFFSRG
jgi:hypothetical protein